MRPAGSERADRVFHALADPTRRDIVAVVLQAESSVSGLARRYPMSVTAVQKHVAVLERAGLVAKRRHGREQRVFGRVEDLRHARGLLDELEALWRGRVGRIDALLAETPADAPGAVPSVHHPTDPEGAPA
ncbi:MAG: ArsR/SmtB family transcription factor [Kineosporiaceae bacterium]